MGEFFRSFLIDPFEDGIGGFFIGIFMWLLTIACALLVFTGVFMLFDSCGQQVLEKEGIVTDMVYHEAYQTTEYTKYGDLTVPHTVEHPATYKIEVEIDGQKGTIGVYEYFYYNTQRGDKVMCKYQKGRYSDAIYIDEIYKN